MYFKKLELVGFKSFLEKTTLEFEPGITAIVGPNGTGKSNIFDAIRWVLGEQSVKALRGSDMQDVIFNGTDTKESLSMAQVNLVFDNEKRLFAVDHDEVAVTRRIFRSGESEYLLNKTPVRLKDILEILSGTGIGSEGYSLVEQGKIDLILSSRPEDRRLIFDEASGITKYKTQKKEALRRLEETEQNLLRVNDIITEVKRQISSLERQANKARRYKEVFEELKSKEITLAVLQKKAQEKQKSEIISNLCQLETEEARLLNTISEQEAKINSQRNELKSLEDNITAIKEEIQHLDNLIVRNKEHIKLNKERIVELESTKKYLETQIEQTKNKISLDKEKLNNLKAEYENIKKDVVDKSAVLKEKEGQLLAVTSSVKASQDNIAKAKRTILDAVTKTAAVKNEIGDSSSKQQIHLARKKRLELERAKVREEKAIIEGNLCDITQEVERLNEICGDLNSKISELKKESDDEEGSLKQINSDLDVLEKQKLVLESQKEFLEKLQDKYENIEESMNAIIYLDKLPRQKIEGLVVKIKDYLDSNNLKLSGEAKPIDLDTQKINEKIEAIRGKITELKNSQKLKESRITELNKFILDTTQDLHRQEMALVNKRSFHKNISEQLNSLKEEEDIIAIELSDLQNELSLLEEKLSHFQSELCALDKEQKQAEDQILGEQNNIALNGNLKEEALVKITQLKTELKTLTLRITTDESTLSALTDTYEQDKFGLLNLESQAKEVSVKNETLQLENKDLEDKINAGEKSLQEENNRLQEIQGKDKVLACGISDVAKYIELDKKELAANKNKLYELQMQNKDIDFKLLGIKERMLAAYKVDLEGIFEIPREETNEDTLALEIPELKQKLDAYGTVNLVAIEEYDELKKRYDFLTQQQNDLIGAKDSLHEAIQKINRTTRKMFWDAFEKISQEFRNYFRLLFNGGDAQIFLIDEQDPLESGIEIICRPPGKKLQNVLLLSGGEKALSAIALLFSVFKVKPAPFCVLDEIDAALDEANIERFSRILQEFAHISQFIVITHNKRTIANADVMYGITMQESGVSRIVSVKFAKDKAVNDKEPDVAVAETV